MSAGYWDDTEREDSTLTEVRPCQDGWYSVASSNGWSCSVSAEYGVEPQVGDRFVTWGAMGRPMRGQAINGRVLYYRTPAEQEVQDQKDRDRAKADRIGQYEGRRAEFDAKVAALPPLFRQRVEDFRAHGGDAWRWDFEAYEVMVCEQAAALAVLFPTVDAVRAFGALEYEAQKAAFPQMEAGHSGNSWGHAIRLAHLAADRPDLIPQMHGALCPLVGCDAYGCYATRNRDEVAR